MKCPLTYKETDSRYSKEGLKKISPKLLDLKDFPYTAKEQIEMTARNKLSIQGVQPKLSAILSIKSEIFEVVEEGGLYIFKPPHNLYREVSENEDLTMHLGRIGGLEIPLHGLVYNIDGSLNYFIKRFDRQTRNKKLATEDFAQVLNFNRETKYQSSMEKLVDAIENKCSFPMLEKIKLFKRVLFNFLVGNEDAHVKNFSLIRRSDKIEMSPCYDLLNTCILSSTNEEIALPLRGKKNRLNRSDFFDYYAKERLALSDDTIKKILVTFKKAYPQWIKMIEASFLSEEYKILYKNVLQERWQRIIA